MNRQSDYDIMRMNPYDNYDPGDGMNLEQERNEEIAEKCSEQIEALHFLTAMYYRKATSIIAELDRQIAGRRDVEGFSTISDMQEASEQLTDLLEDYTDMVDDIKREHCNAD